MNNFIISFTNVSYIFITDPVMSSSEDEGFSQRVVASFFEKFERYECQELLGHFASHWLLSSDDYKVPTEPPSGMITQIQNVNQVQKSGAMN